MNPLMEMFLRWGHIIAAICWVGMLYFFNFVNVPFQGTIDPATKKIVNPQLLIRALWWFRWAAMATMLLGLALFIVVYMQGKLIRDAETQALTDRALISMVGMTLGLIMWFNVWFIIWPAQKRIIGGMLSGTPAPPQLGKRALFTSRLNAYLSGPMLFLMIAAPHVGTLCTMGWTLAFAVPMLVIFLAIKVSSSVGKSL